MSTSHETQPKTERRWLASVIAASSEPLPDFPWMRHTRRRPQAMLDASSQDASSPAIHPRRVTLANR